MGVEQRSREQLVNTPLNILPGIPVVVGGEFILQVHFGRGQLRLGMPAKIGIFALSQTPIQREDFNDKKAKSKKQKHLGKVTFLSLSFNRGKKNLIGQTNVTLIDRTFDTFCLDIQSLTPIEIRYLDHDLDVRDTSEAQSILNPDWFESPLGPATEDDISNRKRFEIARALKNFRQGTVTPIELVFLKKKGLITHTSSRSRHYK